jgi:hypothetical protein
MGLAIVIVLGYSYFVLSGLLRGPRILLSTPENGFSTTTPLITIAGVAVHSNNLTINGAMVPLDLEGNFRSQLILAPGYNIMTIAARDHYNRTVEQRLEINLLPTEVQTNIATSTQ